MNAVRKSCSYESFLRLYCIARLRSAWSLFKSRFDFMALGWMACVPPPPKIPESRQFSARSSRHTQSTLLFPEFLSRY